jgi:hypothetical protein
MARGVKRKRRKTRATFIFKVSFSYFRFPSAMLIRSALFIDITQWQVVILYRRFATGPMRCSETSVKDYHSTLRNIPEQRRSFFQLSDRAAGNRTCRFGGGGGTRLMLYSGIPRGTQEWSYLFTRPVCKMLKLMYHVIPPQRQETKNFATRIKPSK